MGETKAYRLPKKEILRDKREIGELLKKGRRIRGKFCMFYYSSCECRKVAFLVSKRLGIAVRRNLVKRWLRELYRTHRNLAGEKFIMAIYVSSDNQKLSFETLKGDITKLFTKIRNDLSNIDPV